MCENPHTAIVVVILVFVTQDTIAFSQEPCRHAISVELANVENDEAFVDVVKSELVCVFFI